MVRRRRDQAHAGGGVADRGNPRIHLRAGQLTAFARFCTLRHLDLNFFGVDQVFAGDAKTAGGNLLDLALARVAVGVGTKRAGSSPPSPVLLLPPMRFMATASASCASLLMEP